MSKNIRLPEAKEFLWQYIHATPMAPLVVQAGKQQIAALERDVIAGWKPWAKDDGIVYEQQLLVSSART